MNKESRVRLRLTRDSFVGNEAQKRLKGIAVFPKCWEGPVKHITPLLVQHIGFPLVAKLPLFVHKTEKKAVRVVHTQEMLQKTLQDFKRIAQKEKKKCTVLLQEFVQGTELILGLKKDAVFGHVIMLGLGGVFAEVFHDVTFRVCPITEQDAWHMIDELKSKTLLEGPRGLPKANKKSLVQALVKLSQLPRKYPKLSELDINPLMVNNKGAFAVDVRISEFASSLRKS